MQFAREVIAEFGGEEELLGIFEMETDKLGNVKKIKLAEWVMVLIQHYRLLYGNEEGDHIMKKVVTNCIVDNQTVH